MFMWTALAPAYAAPDSAIVLDHDGRFGDAEVGAAVRGRHADAEPAVFGEGLVEVRGEGVRGVVLGPVGVWEAGADLGHGFADGALSGREVWIVELEVLGCTGVDGADPGAGAA